MRRRSRPCGTCGAAVPRVTGWSDAAVAEAEAAEALPRGGRSESAIFRSSAAGVVGAASGFDCDDNLYHKPKPKPAHVAQTIHGTILKVYPVSREIGVAPRGRRRRQTVRVKDQDPIYINGQRHLLDELEENDLVEITKSDRSAHLKDVREIRATRPHQFEKGNLASKDEAAQTIELLVDGPTPQTLKVFRSSRRSNSAERRDGLSGSPRTLATLDSRRPLQTPI